MTLILSAYNESIENCRAYAAWRNENTSAYIRIENIIISSSGGRNANINYTCKFSKQKDASRNVVIIWAALTTPEIDKYVREKKKQKSNTDIEIKISIFPYSFHYFIFVHKHYRFIFDIFYQLRRRAYCEQNTSNL